MKPTRHISMMEQCSMKYTATDKTAKEKTKSKNIKTRVIPGYHLSLGIVVTMLSAVSYTHLDVYKRQSLLFLSIVKSLVTVLLINYLMQLKCRKMMIYNIQENIRIIPVSYTHLDLYKRQVL